VLEKLIERDRTHNAQDYRFHHKRRDWSMSESLPASSTKQHGRRDDPLTNWVGHSMAYCWACSGLPTDWQSQLKTRTVLPLVLVFYDGYIQQRYGATQDAFEARLLKLPSASTTGELKTGVLLGQWV